jgi:YgiT-type zinc finger domain-containing protein
MKCHVCGGLLEPTITDMPFKTSAKRIVIFKGLPVLQCGSCAEYLVEDSVMGQIDAMLAKADEQAELEILSYAA